MRSGIGKIDSFEAFIIAFGAGGHDILETGVTLSGDWTLDTSGEAYMTNFCYTDQAASRATFAFFGTQLTLYFMKYSTRGNLLVTIDGGTEITVAQYSTTLLWQQTWTSSVLASGLHQVSLRRGTAIAGFSGFEVTT